MTQAAGYVQTTKEGPYDPRRSDGVDRLIRSVEEAGALLAR